MIIERQRKTKDPCPGCALHRSRCVCEFIPSLDLKTRVTLIVHAKELKRTTNTGALALKGLVNSQMLVRGRDHSPLDLSPELSDGYRTLLFYPSEDAVELDHEYVSRSPRPIQLLVPDGNWRQASKVHYRHPELKEIPRVMISTPNPELNFLRAENTEHGMATLQAIALALGIIEGPKIQSELMRLYDKKLAGTLSGRGIKQQEKF